MGHRCASLALLVGCVGFLGACGDNRHLDEPALLISPDRGFFTSEAGTTAMFNVVLTAEPLEDVIVDVSSTNAAEGVVTPRALIFDADNFARAQAVTITGVDDERADGERRYAVRLGTDRLGSFELDVVNGDNDVAGIAVTPLVGLMTSEGGMHAEFTVRLTSEPSAMVSVPVTTSDSSEGSTTTTELTFTAADWDVPQVVRVSGVQDGAADGTITYSIVLGVATSTDAGYHGLDPDDVQLVNVDDDVRGVVVAGSNLATAESGTQDDFAVVLQTAPTSTVTIAVMSSDTSEATVSTTQLVFTTNNWFTPQTVTVTGVNDAIDDDNQSFTIVLGATVSTDPDYSGVAVADVNGVNADDDTAGISVAPTNGLSTNEAGSTAMFTVRLLSQPTAPVSIGVSSSDMTEGTAAPTPLMFTSADWSTPKPVTITGVDDAVMDGDVAYTILLAAATSTDAKYSGANAPDVSVTNIDNDRPGITVDPLQVSVSEFSDAEQVTIVLDSPPTANVTIGLSSSNELEARVFPTSVTFTPTNWNVPQLITITGVNDTIADGNQQVTIITAPATSADPAYAGINPADVAVTNIDNDTAQVYVKARRRLTVTETGGSTTFRMRLTVTPTATVTCTLQSSDTTEGTVSPTTLTFQPNNFGFQTVTVTGVDDTIDDNDVVFTIVTNPCTSADLAYQNSNPFDVGVINRDNE